MVSTRTLLSYPYWKIPFTLHTDTSDKQLGDVISQSNKPIELFSKGIINSQRNHTMNNSELLAIV